MIYLFNEFGISKEGYGGGQEILLQISKVLVDKKEDFRIFTVLKCNEVHVENEIKEKLVLVRDSSIPLLSSLWLAIEFIKRVFFKPRPNKVLVFTSEALLISLICKILKIRCISYIAAPKIPKFGLRLADLTAFKKNIQLIIFLVGAKFCSNNYSISHEIKRQCLESIFGFKEEEIDVAYPGIDHLYKRRTIPNPKKKSILYLGRICSKQKSTDLILKSLKLVTKSWTKFIIIGSGNANEEGKIQKIMMNRSLKKKVKIISSNNKNKIIKIASEARLAVLTSNYESFQISVYEILNQVDKLIISDVADHKRLIPKLNSVRFSKLNRYSLSRHIKREIVAKSSLDYRYKKNIMRKLNEKLTWENLVDSLI